MVFGLFSRKSTDTLSGAPLAPPDPKASEQASTSDATAASVTQLRTPSPSIVSGSTGNLRGSPLRQSISLQPGTTLDSVAHDDGNAPLPPNTPSPAPEEGADAGSLYELMLTIPPKTLHSYTLAHLKPRNTPTSSVPLQTTASPFTPSTVPHPSQIVPSTSPPPSPRTASALTTFFRSLRPPPALHCVRCHKDYFDVENDDHSCLVAHDDNSALVERLPGGAYETLWECCGRTTPGDGSEGPPDGWCYEGRHTTDAKRARFRADSTIHNDKLVSCLRRNCHGIRSQLPSSSSKPAAAKPESRASRTTGASADVFGAGSGARSSRKRPRVSMKEASSSEAEAEGEKEPAPALPDGDEPEAEESGAESDAAKRSATKKKRRGSGASHKRIKSDASVLGLASDAESQAKSKPKAKPKTAKAKPRASSPGKAKAKSSDAEGGESMAMDVDAPEPAPAPAPEAKPAAKPKSRVARTKTAATLASDSEASTAAAASRSKVSARRKSDIGAGAGVPKPTPTTMTPKTKAKKNAQKEEEEESSSGEDSKKAAKPRTRSVVRSESASRIKGRSESKVRFSVEVPKGAVKEKKAAVDDVVSDSEEEESQRGRKKRRF